MVVSEACKVCSVYMEVMSKEFREQGFNVKALVVASSSYVINTNMFSFSMNDLCQYQFFITFLLEF